MQTVMVQDTGADADAFAATLLDRAPGPGVVEIWVASTVNTATYSLDVGGENVIRTQVVPLRTNGIPNISDDSPITVPVGGGEKILLALAGTTGTIHSIARFTPEDEL